MTLAARLAALALLALAIPALADEAAAPWGDIEIAYDTAVWRVAAPKSETDWVTLTCIARDCPGKAQVFAFVGSTAEETEKPYSHNLGPLLLDGPALPFVAEEIWSGCRAMDQPILSASLDFRGRRYRLVTSLSGGCNFEAPMPVARFKNLVEKIRFRDMRTLAIGGLRIAYDARRWTPRPGGNVGLVQGVRMTCTLRECQDWKGAPSYVRMSATRDPDGKCAASGEIAEGYAKGPEIRHFGGLRLELWKTFSGCRARTPRQINACGIHEGTAYRFTSGLHSGCSAGIEGVPDALFEELLSGIVLAEDIPAPP